MMKATPTTTQGANDAVAALGAAMDASREALSGVTQESAALAARLARDPDALAKVPELVEAHAASVAALEDALSQIWPRSSPTRPRDPRQASDACRRLADLIRSPLAPSAARLASLAEADRQRIAAEADHALDTEARLESLGADVFGDPDAVAVAALAMDRLTEAHGTRDLADAERLRADLEALLAAVEEATTPALDLCVALGFPGATASQAGALAQALAKAPLPWSLLCEGHGDVSALSSAVAERRDFLFRVDASCAKLDARFGMAWRGADPSKLSAAAAILSDAEDTRGDGAYAYARFLGVDVERDASHKALRAMARAISATQAAPPAVPSSELLPSSIPIGDVAGCDAATAYLTEVESWLRAMTATAVLRKASAALAALPATERLGHLANAPAVAKSLAALPPAETRHPLSELPRRIRSRLDAVTSEVALASAVEGDEAIRARKAARALKERRLALGRIASAPGFVQTGASDPEELVRTRAWSRSIAAELPPGLDPASPYVTSNVLDAAGTSVRESMAAMGALREIGSLAGREDVDFLVAAAALSGVLRAVDVAQSLVDETEGWDVVARLEEEGIAPGLWGDALSGKLVKPQAPEPGVPAQEQPLTSDVQPPVRPRRQAFDFADASLWRNIPLAVA